MTPIRYALILLALLVPATAAVAQQSQIVVTAAETPAARDAGATATPRLVRFSGAFRDPSGAPMAGTHGLTFALYSEREGGAPIWLETHNVTFDEQGRYSVLLGANSEVGLGPELFAAGEPRWLGVQLQLPGWQEEPRALMVSVPYALKALDAETLGGLPPSAFLLATPPEGAPQQGGWTAAGSARDLPGRHYTETAHYIVKYPLRRREWKIPRFRNRGRSSASGLRRRPRRSRCCICAASLRCA